MFLTSGSSHLKHWSVVDLAPFIAPFIVGAGIFAAGYLTGFLLGRWRARYLREIEDDLKRPRGRE